MNYNNNHEVLINTINMNMQELEKNKESNYKILKALKDAKDSLDSINELNPEERAEFFKIIFISYGMSCEIK